MLVLWSFTSVVLSIRIVRFSAIFFNANAKRDLSIFHPQPSIVFGCGFAALRLYVKNARLLSVSIYGLKRLQIVLATAFFRM
jgi:hypothetical protein